MQYWQYFDVIWGVSSTSPLLQDFSSLYCQQDLGGVIEKQREFLERRCHSATSRTTLIWRVAILHFSHKCPILIVLTVSGLTVFLEKTRASAIVVGVYGF